MASPRADVIDIFAKRAARRDMPGGLEWMANSDRRSARRYKLRFQLRYRVRTRSGVVYTGTGVTQNISCKGIQFTTDDKALPKGFIQLYVEWPVLSDGRPLELQVIGSVVRTDETGVAIRAVRHEFFRILGSDTAPRETPVLAGS